MRTDLRDNNWNIIAVNDDGNATLDISQMPNTAKLRLRCMATDGLSNGTTMDVGWLKVEK
ncbi:hypothetical protein HYU06_05485 [Candidatus Woesearchaeota archaeon]|nr:hypothetical protein [Candidatus Woesearchaeota archaeon]